MAEPILTDHHFIDLEAKPTIGIRIRKPMAELDMSELFDTQLPRIFHFATSSGHPPTGAPYARYFEFGPTQADIEIGVPVAESAAVAPIGDQLGEPGASELPAGKAAKVVHHGPYDTLGQAYDALHDWIHEHAHEDGAGPWEVYVDDPSKIDDPAEIRTEIYWPVSPSTGQEGHFTAR